MANVALLALLPLVAGLSLEKPFKETASAWSFSGDYVQGNDVVRLGTQPDSAAAVWSASQLPYTEWTVEAKIRTFAENAASDPGRSGIALWFTSQPLAKGPVHGSADKWDGLAIMMDSLGWDETGSFAGEDTGAIRGHLNDGSSEFMSSAHPAAEAFSLCRIPYRKVKGPVTLRVGYGRGVLVVDVNGQKCFMTDRVALPVGFVGASADTSSSTDTFALDSVRITEGIADDLAAHMPADRLAPALGSSNHAAAPAAAAPAAAAPVAAAPLAAAPVAAAPEAAVAAVDDKAIKEISESIAKLAGNVDALQSSLASNVESLQSSLAAQAIDKGGDNGHRAAELLGEQIQNLGKRLDRTEDLLEKLVAGVNAISRNTVSDELRTLRSELSSMSEHHRTLPSSLQDSIDSSRPSLFVLILGVLAGQGLVFVLYSLYVARKQRHQKLL